MVSPRDSLEIVARTIAESGELPTDMGVVLHEADGEQEDANVDMPLIEIQMERADHVQLNNSDLVGWITDDSGNRVGRRYFAEYELTLEINLWTSTDDGYNPDTLGESVRAALYPHVAHGPHKSFLDDEGNTVDEMYYFAFVDGVRADDLIETPTVRKWRQQVELWACEEFRTTEDYIVSVNAPESGEAIDDVSTDADIEFTQ